MALPKEPRQKMINLMYLVLTALLALNVSAEILNAFKTVNRSLETTNVTIDASTATIMTSFEEKKKDPTSAAKATQWEPKAKQAIALTAEINSYIEGLKDTILRKAGFNPTKENNNDSTFKEDNQDIATKLLVEDGKGKELYNKLKAYKDNIAKIEPSLAKEMNVYLQQIDLSIPPSKSSHGNNAWESVYFRMVPTVAAITMLSKFQNDLKTVENKVVAEFHEQVGAVKVRYNKFAAIVGQNSNYLMPGQKLEINAGIGAFSTDALPQVTIGGQTLPLNAEGQAVYTTTAAGSGEQSVTVNINYKDQDGTPQTVTKTVSYTVGQAGAAISMPEMNVLYIGYPNKIVVSGGGVGLEKININVSGGGANPIKTKAGEWIVNVSQQTDACTISAVADGKQIGQLVYRVRNIPPPVASVGGKKSGDAVSPAALSAQPGVAAGIENFPLPLKYSVVRFVVVGNDENGDIARAPCTGNLFTSNAKNIIRQSQEILTIEDIYCQGPDGKVFKMPSMFFNLN